MSKYFTYSLLQYTPSEGLGEALNIGVLLLFPDLNRSHFVSPRSLTRLKKAFPTTSERLVRGYLRSITYNTKQLSTKPELWASLDLGKDTSRFIAQHLLIPDASAIRFSPPRVALRYSTPEQIAEDYEKKYLGVYQAVERVERENEVILIRRFKKQLREIDAGLINKVEENYKLRVAEEEYQFDFSWQNGHQNLVKALSFDFKRADSIQRKAERYFGQILLLEPTAKARELHFDLLLAPPQKRSLTKSYDRALGILEKLPHTDIWEGERIADYTQHAAQSLLLE